MFCHQNFCCLAVADVAMLLKYMHTRLFLLVSHIRSYIGRSRGAPWISILISLHHCPAQCFAEHFCNALWNTRTSLRELWELGVKFPQFPFFHSLKLLLDDHFHAFLKIPTVPCIAFVLFAISLLEICGALVSGFRDRTWDYSVFAELQWLPL